jgi:hypothetical protein
VGAATDPATGATCDGQDGPGYQEDDTDRPQDRDSHDETDDQQDDSESDHLIQHSFAGKT